MASMNRWTITQLSQRETQWNNYISEKTISTLLDDETLGVLL